MKDFSSRSTTYLFDKSVKACVVLVSLSIMFITSCSNNNSTKSIEEPLSFQITKGACGNVVFEEVIGSDSTSAIDVVRSRKIDRYGQDTVELETFGLRVQDENGNIPSEEFYAVKVLDKDKDLLLHSVHEVITNKGNLYTLHWCPD